MILLFAFLFTAFNVVHCQFPRVCTTPDAMQDKVCCPIWKDGSRCGSLSGRGECRDHIVFVPFTAERARQRMYDDDRLDWPRYYFDSTCECFGNYGGYDCGDCRFGHFGVQCDRTNTVVRKAIDQLSFLERQRFFSYLALAKTTISRDFVILTTGDRHHQDTYKFVDASIYNVFSFIHYYSTKSLLVNGTFDGSSNYAHQGPAFPGWHRLGLLFLERQMQLMTGDENFALPYYDWRGENTCSICTNDFVGANDIQGSLDKYSYFASWKSICSGYSYEDAYCLSAEDECQMEILHRKPGVQPRIPTLPSIQDVENTLKWNQFDVFPFNRRARRSFRNVLEGFMRPSDGITPERSMHNLVHLYFGGTMAEVPISSSDPMFLLHHCFIDKIFEQWIIRHNATTDMYPENDVPGQGPDDCSTPYLPCYRNKDFLRNSTNFGYCYSEFKGL